jgi:hypothetical protein
MIFSTIKIGASQGNRAAMAKKTIAEGLFS